MFVPVAGRAPGVSNGHSGVDGKTGLAICPLCNRLFTDDNQAARGQAKHEEPELARAELFERQLEALALCC